ncbi:hypothetical protein FACS189434_12720 [Bacteroidia bacterium]|nr:hypothetical protein FACS189434_12720 [Bacteroidia bacterium]
MTKTSAILSFILFAILSFSAKAQDSRLPSVSLKNTDGKAIDTSTLENDGKPFIVSFFATWCKPCLRELKAISEVYDDWQEETGVKIIIISIDEVQNIHKVKPLADGQGWEYEILLDPNGDFKRALNIRAIPASLIIDGKGKIVNVRTGYTEGSEDSIIEEIRKLKTDG